MKPFLGVDLTANNKNDEMHGSEFLIQKPSAALSQALEHSIEGAQDTEEKAKIPLGLRIARYLCGFILLIFVGSFYRAGVTFAEGYQNVPWLYWLSGFSAVTFVILTLLGKRKSKTVLESEESTQTFAHLDNVAEAIYRELGVPQDAKAVDVLSFFYKSKDGNIKMCEKPMQLYQSCNPEFKIYTDSENLYLANLEDKYAFPLSSLNSIQTVDKKVRVMGWNKETNLHDDIYKEYKLTTDNYGCVHCKQYHILEVNHQGVVFGIYFPNYELPTFEEITGLKAPKE